MSLVSECISGKGYSGGAVRSRSLTIIKDARPASHVLQPVLFCKPEETDYIIPCNVLVAGATIKKGMFARLPKCSWEMRWKGARVGYRASRGV